MADIDKVLEAEETIKSIATELGRMKSAADIMDSAQTKIDAVIDTSSEIISRTGEFVKAGSQIVERIGDYDIQGDLSKIIEYSKTIRGDVEKIFKNLEDTRESLDKLKTDLEAFTDEKFKDIGVSLNEVRERNDHTAKIFMGLVGGNILLVIILLLKIFQVF